LADVLHYFMPEAEAETLGLAPTLVQRGIRRSSPAALPLVAVPIGDRDVVRAAFTWNLVFEIGRLGGQSSIVAPIQDGDSPLWPEPAVRSLAANVVLTEAGSLSELYRAAMDVAVAKAADSDDGGLVLVRVPPQWLPEASDSGKLLRWSLLFTSSDSRELVETYGIAKLLMSRSSKSRVGVTIHGARRMEEARGAFAKLTQSSIRHIGCELLSYGLLVDDLDVYRAIVAQRPIGLAHPQSAASRALRDVASILLEDARKASFV
jgi:hypothetical protein